MDNWIREEGPRVKGSRPLDSAKVQAPGVVALPEGGYRLFYTAVGPGKPFPDCQGYILSAVSEDGLDFEVETGIRVAPDPESPFMNLRTLAPTVTRLQDGRWRMYFEGRSSADRPTVIASALSEDMLNWQVEEGVRLVVDGGIRAPRYVPLAAGGRLYAVGREPGAGIAVDPESGVLSAVTADGVHFDLEPGYRFPRKAGDVKGSFSAAEVVAPGIDGGEWSLFFSEWEEPPAGNQADLPPHPSQESDAVARGLSADFAAISIAHDLAGFRSRIFVAHSPDGTEWNRGGCVVEGEGYDGSGLDAVHAEDMSIARLDDGRYRMYYAACDTAGTWLVASAITAD